MGTEYAKTSLSASISLSSFCLYPVLPGWTLSYQSVAQVGFRSLTQVSHRPLQQTVLVPRHPLSSSVLARHTHLSDLIATFQ